MDTSALSSICNGFGHIDVEENRYVKGKYCLDNLKDLQRFLRRDDPAERPVFKQLCRWKVVGRELVPLLESSQNDQKIVINIVKVLVFLTMPVDPTSEDIPQQVDYLWQSKGVLARNVTIALIVSLLEEPLEHLESATFTEDDWKLVQLVFTLFRNLLAVQDVLSQQNKSGSTQYLQLREHFLELLFEENVMDLILVLVQHINDTNGYLRQDNLLLLEIFHYIFHGHNPELLAKASTKNLKVTEGFVPNVDSVSSIVAEEEKKSRPGRARNVKHCSYSDGMFTCRTIDGNKALVKGHPSSILDKFLVKARQVQRGPLKKIALDTRNLSLPNDSVLKLLCNFLNTFLSGGYNDLMQSVLEDIEKDQDHLQSGDISIFFQVACFVIAFQRHKFSDFRPQNDDCPTSEASADNKLCTSADGDICSPIAATLNEGMLFLVISKWREAFDSLKQTHDYQTLSSTGSLMKNMIRMLDLLLKVMPDDSCESRTVRVLLYKLFYDQTAEGFTQFLMNQIKSFDTHKQAKSDLVDLVEIFHVILRLMENLQQRGSLRVSRKSRKGRKKKPSSAIAEAEKLSGEPIPLPDDNNSYGKSLLSHANLGKRLNQSLEASAAQLFHDDAADAPLDPTGEPGMHTLISENRIKGLSQTDIVKASHDLSYQTDGSSDDEYQQVTNEVDFNVSKLVSEFATSSAIQNICWLLKFCKTNSPSTNYYIVRMLQRICNDLELSPLLYQLSFLVIFYDILSDEKMRKRCPDIVCFLTKLVRGMMKKIKNQPLLFVDILFLKSRKDCHMINAEGIEHELGYMKNEIEGLHGGGKCLTKGFVHSSHKNLAEALGEDEADHIFPQELQNDMEAPPFRDELQDLDKPTETENNGNCMATIGNGDLNADKSLGDGLHQRESTRRKKLIITHEQEMVIRDLYEKFKEERRCTHLISEALDSQGKISPLQVSCKLRQLGLKVSRRENRHAHSHCPSREIQNEGSKLDGVAPSCHPFRLEDNSLLNFHRRKRIHAFNQDQETLIKDLFEQFKGSKKCSRMIANALDDNNKYTAAQVSRKLKQLGLLPQRKKETNDRNSSAVEANSEENSDDETLLTMLSRSKNKRRKISNKKSQNGHADLLHHGSKSDREPSSALLNDLSRLSMPEKNDAAEEIIEPASLDDELEDEIYVDGSKQTEDPAASDLVIHDSDKIDELANSGEGLGGTTYLKRSGMRRKLTIDVGYEDDD